MLFLYYLSCARPALHKMCVTGLFGETVFKSCCLHRHVSVGNKAVLVFHIPTKRNISELVFAETLSTDTLLDMLPSGVETTQSSELSQTESKNEKGTTKCQTKQEDARTLYTAELFLKRHLSDTPGMSCPWPPTSETLNVTEAQTVVPLALYNVVSWILGATEEPTLDHYVNIADDLHLKVLSVCQDIVYLASKGRKQSLTLRLTV